MRALRGSHGPARGPRARGPGRSHEKEDPRGVSRPKAGQARAGSPPPSIPGQFFGKQTGRLSIFWGKGEKGTPGGGVWGKCNAVLRFSGADEGGGGEKPQQKTATKPQQCCGFQSPWERAVGRSHGDHGHDTHEIMIYIPPQNRPCMRSDIAWDAHDTR